MEAAEGSTAPGLMAASSRNLDVMTIIKENVKSMPKWKVLLLFGTPVAVAFGMYYIKNYHPRKSYPRAKSSDPFQATLVSKEKGNVALKHRQVQEAIAHYTQAISDCPPDEIYASELSKIYQNRAFAHEILGDVEETILDCDEAIRLDPTYVRPIIRRAKALEFLGDLEGALEDLTMATILEEFKNPNMVKATDRMLKAIGKKTAKEEFPGREPIVPSAHFIRTYFSSFRRDPIFNQSSKTTSAEPTTISVQPDSGAGEGPDPAAGEGPDPTKTNPISFNGPSVKTTKEGGDDDGTVVIAGDGKPSIDTTKDVPKTPFQMAKTDLLNGDEECFCRLLDFCLAHIKEGQNDNNTNSNYVEALLTAATLLLLQGRSVEAMRHLDTLLQLPEDLLPSDVRVNALIKRGSLWMQWSQEVKALDDLAMAEEADPLNPDVFNHRGQLRLLLEQTQAACDDFARCVDLAPQFIVARFHTAFTRYKHARGNLGQIKDDRELSGLVEQTNAELESLLSEYPDCAEGWALRGQVMTDEGRYQEADRYFKKALEVEPDNGNVYVHLGLCHLQWKYSSPSTHSEPEADNKYLLKALEVDPKCEFAYETLGTVEVQRGRLTSATTLFQEAIRLAKTEAEMAHLVALDAAARAQLTAAQRLGISLENGP